ncbi:MAG: 3D-(3,5/4)-trihydroxycyclohexane-1,2-dione acylhydrolase (decyclizing) [Verrucomicrobiae bacterium]|nr:3D-(3,5/4)-trihydroxycyclohexane-1,2-dione acylhydrolase (decyclizing) [Verrucomicrobiae bacterium]
MNKEKKIKLTVGQAVVKYLQVQYSELDGRRHRIIPGIAGIFGHGNVCGLAQGLIEYGHDMTFYQCRHEQSLVHMASGFAKANARLSTLACTSSIGPGATNMVTGAATATVNRLPVLLLPGDYYCTREQGQVLQQIEHPISRDASANDCFRPVSRYFDRVTRAEHILTALPEAMRVLMDPAETGAAVVALCQDLQSHAYEYPTHFFEPRVWRIERRMPDPDRIREVASLLKKARKPVIIAGGGVMYSFAQTELQEFAEKSGIAVVETSAGKGAIQKETSLLMGGAGFNGTGCAGRVMAEADLVICVGTRLSDFTTGSRTAFQNPSVKFVGINVCSHDAYKVGALPVLADAKRALQSLTKVAAALGVKVNAARVKQVAGYRRQWEATMKKESLNGFKGEFPNTGQVITTINEVAKPGDTLVAAAGLPPGDVLKAWNATGGRLAHLEFGNSCMTYEIPAAIGVKMATPKNEVRVLIGDGTFLMLPTEVVTAVQERKKITIVIMENHGFQSIRGLQMVRVGRSFGNEFRSRDARANRLEGEYLNLDLAALAGAMGAKTYNTQDVGGLKEALLDAARQNGPCVIVVETEKHRYLPGAGVWIEFEPAETTQDPVTRKLRQEHEAGKRKLQRYYY